MNKQEKQEANEQCKAEEKVVELIFNKEVEEFVKCKIACNANRHKAYAYRSTIKQGVNAKD